MAHQQTETLSVLSVEMTKRLKQLGLSRREFERRSGLSRQTLFKIEVEGHTDLRDHTYQVLDEHLKWVPGTALALSQGDARAVESADALTLADRESAYRWRIVEKIQNMSLRDLETMVALMEARTLGEVTASTAEHLGMMEERIKAVEGMTQSVGGHQDG